MLNYKTDNMEKCEYMELMLKTFFQRPKQENGKCEGYRNRYTREPSTVCKRCNHFNNK